MSTVNVEAKNVCGVSIRTTNAAEASGRGKIGELWATFSQELQPHLSGKPYAVYYDYESDADGEYSVLVGGICNELRGDHASLQQVKLKAGRYRTFHVQGPMPATSVQLWQQIWEHYRSGNEKRAFTTDFELYDDNNNISIFIALE